MSGLFIVTEGPDGSGTTLHSRMLAEKFADEGREVFLTAEPTGSPIGTWIREILQEGGPSIPPPNLQLLFCADRAWHTANLIVPALKEGKVVISNRYMLSTIIYGTSQDIEEVWLKEMNKFFVQPDLTVLTIPPLAVCLERIGRREKREIFEEESLLKKIHDRYRMFSETNDPSVITVDTSGEKEESADKIWKAVKKKMKF